MKDGIYNMIESEQLGEMKKRYDIHRKFHFKMRDFIVEKGLETEFYEIYFPEGDSLLKEWVESLQKSKSK